MLEIERKFRVKNTTFLSNIKESYKITQGYLNSSEDRTVRVRIKGNQGFLTIKGKSSENGLSRFEWEKEISVLEATELLKLCEDFVISKTRHLFPFNDVVFEVDVFEGANEGLIVAEVELNSENQTFEKPDWLGDELTGDLQYYNSYLSNHPYTTWNR
ncbi:CYTH domain-containing protein [Flavobacterium sp. xlx-214]|uniref:CYTH domain-containing protein n=1 Tax=unclassified Flavobacterium TaxID=196869 RepID=UPI0013D556FA|nr:MULTISPECIES: CYTH domain-containing protein [unclassified Flavobacterium]MBA5793666.1 CYTH domain-containing protein [Flavobacterium sp. xlx-221]QMI84591.1 CYTH domain-containing protein [Flavobacterium sp. xlx-214]